MAAEVLANELRLDLYRIDLSAVVSKYIGETEKNLRRVFDAAEDGGAILLFDEADALFGKRSEVKDSHDRYANIEVSYLLQRMEAYRGLAILTTNLKSALDPAFLRRLRFVVAVPVPRRRRSAREIWRAHLPGRTRRPTGSTSTRWRGSTSPAATSATSRCNAAFLAADAGEPVAHGAPAARPRAASTPSSRSRSTDAEIGGWHDSRRRIDVRVETASSTTGRPGGGRLSRRRSSARSSSDSRSPTCARWTVRRPHRGCARAEDRAMSTFPGSPRLLKGAIVGVDPLNPLASVVVFQYNPETLDAHAQAAEPAARAATAARRCA